MLMKLARKSLLVALISAGTLLQAPTCTDTASIVTATATVVTAGAAVFLVNEIVN